MKKKLVFCYGTRPEFIKIAPVILELKKDKKIKPVLVCSGQHKELLERLDNIFGIYNDYDLCIRNYIGKTVNLATLFSSLQNAFYEKLNELKSDAILVQGDTASVFAAAIAAFHLKIPIFYLEAGLRTHNLKNPYPEEGYRQIATRLADIYFAPTEAAKKNLAHEGIDENKIYITGNTVVDAIKLTRGRILTMDIGKIIGGEKGKKIVLVEVHRRENWGKPMENIFKAIVKLHNENKNFLFVFPVHPNKEIQSRAKMILGDLKRVRLIQPLNYLELLTVLSKSSLVISDSGGLQEEAPSFGVPVIVTRKVTERPEGIKEEWAILGGTNTETIINCFLQLKNWKRPNFINPYGDGKASERIVKIIYEQI